MHLTSREGREGEGAVYCRGKLYANEGGDGEGRGQSIAVESSMLTKGVMVGVGWGGAVYCRGKLYANEGGDGGGGGGGQSIAVESSMLTKGVMVRGGDSLLPWKALC